MYVYFEQTFVIVQFVEMDYCRIYFIITDHEIRLISNRLQCSSFWFLVIIINHLLHVHFLHVQLRSNVSLETRFHVASINNIHPDCKPSLSISTFTRLLSLYFYRSPPLRISRWNSYRESNDSFSDLHCRNSSICGKTVYFFNKSIIVY